MKDVFNLQINKNMIFDRATEEWGLFLSNLYLFVEKQAVSLSHIKENLT